MNSTKLWAWYATGAALALLWKFIIYYRINRKLGKSLPRCIDEWVFEHSPENAASWVATVIVVWAAGVTYIGDIAFAWSDYIDKVPHHPAFASLLGCILEYQIPNAFKWLLSKTPWATQN